MKRLLLLIVLCSMSVAVFSQQVYREKGLYGIGIRESGKIRWEVKPAYVVIERGGNKEFLACDKNGNWKVFSPDARQALKGTFRSKKEAAEAYAFKLNPASKTYVSNGNKDHLSTYPSYTLTKDYTDYMKSYVEQKINQWQKKGEYEKTADYKKRVNEETRNAKVLELTKEVCRECLEKAQDKELRMTLGGYDADNETYLIHSDIGDIVLSVPISQAEDFKANWHKYVSENKYDISKGKIYIIESVLKLNGKEIARYDNRTHALYSQAVVNYNFDPIEIPQTGDLAVSQPNIVTKNIMVGKSDIDSNIPTNSSVDDNTFAIIFANENYKRVAPVSYALNDGETVSKYFIQTLGIDENRIRMEKDATRTDMKSTMKWIKDIGEEFDDINLLVYYVGHGVPDHTKGNEAYLVPIDGDGKDLRSLYKLRDFYDDLGKVNANSIIVFLDACFSGSLHGSGMLAEARSIALTPREEDPAKNMIVFSAAQGDETAWPYEEQSHGMFTYFLLKKLQETKGNVSLGTLTDYVKKEVGKQSVLNKNTRKQTPTVLVSNEMMERWKDVKLGRN